MSHYQQLISDQQTAAFINNKNTSEIKIDLATKLGHGFPAAACTNTAIFGHFCRFKHLCEMKNYFYLMSQALNIYRYCCSPDSRLEIKKEGGVELILFSEQWEDFPFCRF